MRKSTETASGSSSSPLAKDRSAARWLWSDTVFGSGQRSFESAVSFAATPETSPSLPGTNSARAATEKRTNTQEAARAVNTVKWPRATILVSPDARFLCCVAWNRPIRRWCPNFPFSTFLTDFEVLYPTPRRTLGSADLGEYGRFDLLSSVWSSKRRSDWPAPGLIEVLVSNLGHHLYGRCLDTPRMRP